MKNGDYDSENRNSPFDGVEKLVTEALIERVVNHTCEQIASTTDRSRFPDIYIYLTALPVRAVLQMPKPLLDEFWKFVNHLCQADPRDNAAHGLLSLLNGYTSLLNFEDQFQQDFHGIEMEDLLQDYSERLRDLEYAMRKQGLVIADWAKPCFRATRKPLPNPKGNLDNGLDR
jgi:hypothetical protein